MKDTSGPILPEVVSGVYLGGLRLPHLYCCNADLAIEFTGMLEGYENVRAYCYNCKLAPFCLLR